MASVIQEIESKQQHCDDGNQLNIIIIGPNGCGKTQFATKLKHGFESENKSCDVWEIGHAECLLASGGPVHVRIFTVLNALHADKFFMKYPYEVVPQMTVHNTIVYKSHGGDDDTYSFTKFDSWDRFCTATNPTLR